MNILLLYRSLVAFLAIEHANKTVVVGVAVKLVMLVDVCLMHCVCLSVRQPLSSLPGNPQDERSGSSARVVPDIVSPSWRHRGGEAGTGHEMRRLLSRFIFFPPSPASILFKSDRRWLSACRRVATTQRAGLLWTRWSGPSPRLTPRKPSRLDRSGSTPTAASPSERCAQPTEPVWRRPMCRHARFPTMNPSLCPSHLYVYVAKL